MSLLEQFRFLDPGTLVDGDLELVTPADRWVEPLMATLAHPRTRALAPRDAELTHDQVAKFIREFPMGRQPGDLEKGLVPAYHFWMRLRPTGGIEPRVEIAGGIGLRVGHTENLEMYLGHIGYNVYPPARGRRLAARAVRLILPLARRSGLSPLWITCNPDNHPSRRTCEIAGGRLVDVVPLPADHPLRVRGESEKCRYRFDL
jgi:tagatose 1,6-diphosphate aldolase